MLNVPPVAAVFDRLNEVGASLNANVTVVVGLPAVMGLSTTEMFCSARDRSSLVKPKAKGFACGLWYPLSK